MPKNKHQADAGGHHQHHKHKQMDKVKIKRVKRTHKKVSTKEKILGGLGLGSTLIGGVGAISASSQPQTQFVRTNETETNSSSSKIKSALNKVFGIKTAKADFVPNASALLPNAPTGEQSLPYQVSSSNGETTITVGNGSSVSYSSPQELLSILNQANANPGSVDSSLLTALTNNYYGSVYNNSPSVTAAYGSESPGNIAWGISHPNEINPNNMPNPWQMAGAQAITNTQNQVVGSIVHVGGNSATDQIGVWIADPTGGTSGTTKIFGSDAEANAFLRTQGFTSNFNSQTNTIIQTIPQTPPPAGGGTLTSVNFGNTSGYEIWLQADGSTLVGTDKGIVVYLNGVFTLDGQVTSAEYIDSILPGLSGQLINPSTGHIMNPPAMASTSVANQNIINFSGITFTEQSGDGRTWREANIPGLGLVAYENGRVFNSSGTDITNIFDASQMTAISNFFLSDANRSTGGGGTGGGGGGSGATGSGVTVTDVSNAIDSNNTSYLNNLLRGTGMDINAQLASNPELSRQLYQYMVANNMLTGFTNGTLGALILSSNPTVSTTITPGKYGQSWSTEGVTQAYNNALTTFNFSTTKNSSGQVITYIFNINGSPRTFSPQELNSFLNSTWNGGQFMNLSAQDQQIFVAAIQARLQDPNIGLGIPNLPSPNTNDAQAIHFVDSNGNFINFQQGFSPTGQSFRTDAEWLQKMFPGSRIVDAGFPGGTTSSWNPVDSGDPRGYYELVLPDGSRFNVGLFLQGNLEQSNGKTLVTLLPEQVKYFTAPNINTLASVVGTTTGTGTGTGGAGAAGTGGTGAGGAAGTGANGTTTTLTGGQILTASLPAGQVGVSYNQGLSAYNASSSVKNWTVSSGQLPTGLTLNANTGFIYGFPTQGGSYNFTVRATFNNNQTVEKSYSVSISGTSVTTPGASETPAGLNAWVSQTNTSLRVGETKNINAHVADGDAVLVGSNKFTAISTNSAVATVVVAADSNSVAITGRSVGAATIRLHPAGRADTAGDRQILITVTAAGTTTVDTTVTGSTQTGNNNLYPSPTSSGFTGGDSQVVTSTIFNNSGSGNSSVFTNLPETQTNTGGITLVRSSVSEVGDDEGVSEAGELSGTTAGTQPSVSQVGDDEDVESNEVGSAISSVTEVGDDSDVEINEVGAEQSVTQTGSDDEDVEYNEVTEGSALGNSGAAGAGSGAGSGGGSGSSGVGGTAGGLGGSTGSGGSNSAQTITSLQQQVTDLQSRINSLNAQIASLQSSGSGGTNIQPYLQQISQLEQQVASLKATISRIQQAGVGVRVFDQSTGTLQYAEIAPKSQAAGGTYTVKKGDTLWDISQKYYGTGTKWRTILEANPQSLSRPGNVRTLRIGYVLTIPSLTGQTAGQSTVKTYEVQPQAQVQNNLQSSVRTFEQTGSGNAATSLNSGSTLNTSASQSTTQAATGVDVRGNSQNQNQAATGPVIRPSVSDVGDDEEIEVKE